MESILSWFPLTSSHGGWIFCSVTELANRQITRQSTYESIYSFQTPDEKKPGVGTDKNVRAACVTLFANNPGPQSELCFNSTLNTGDCVLTFISSASYWNSQPALSLNDSPLPTLINTAILQLIWLKEYIPMWLSWCVIMGKFISRVFSCLFCVFEEDLTLLLT